MKGGATLAMSETTLDSIEFARERIAGIARRPPLERSRWLSGAGREVLLKLECLQITGSFKIRGAAARLTALAPEEKERGVLTVSAGNHGLAIAHAAAMLNVDVSIVVPESASRAKVDQIKRYPVTVIERGAKYDQAERAARAMERESGKTFVSPYNDPEVIAGQGTVALEILEEAPDIDAVVVPVGGGGLLAGVAIALEAIDPRIKVYGAEPQASPTMTRSLEAGEIIAIDEDETIADGLAGNIEPGSMTFPIVQRLADGILLVDEDAISAAIAKVAREDHLIIEGSAAAAIAALDDGRIRNGCVVVIVTGRNISFDLFMKACAG